VRSKGAEKGAAEKGAAEKGAAEKGVTLLLVAI
jgi:hypothetical protein